MTRMTSTFGGYNNIVKFNKDICLRKTIFWKIWMFVCSPFLVSFYLPKFLSQLYAATIPSSIALKKFVFAYNIIHKITKLIVIPTQNQTFCIFIMSCFSPCFEYFSWHYLFEMHYNSF